MRNFLLLCGAVLPFLFTNGCSSSYATLGYRDQTVYVQLENVLTQLHAQPITQKRTNFSSLFLKQQILRTEKGNLIILETAQTDLSYEFEPTIDRIVNVLFNTRRKVLLYAGGGLFVYQVILENGQVINLIAEKSENQRIKLLYGLTNSQIMQILKVLMGYAVKLPYHGMSINGVKHAFLTQWTDMNVHFYPLVVPLPRLMMPF